MLKKITLSMLAFMLLPSGYALAFSDIEAKAEASPQSYYCIVLNGVRKCYAKP